MNKEVDVLVIGAGPAGAIASAYLNKAGFKVLVVEKQKFPRFVIGESLLPRCMDHLDELDLLEDMKAVGFQEKKGATFYYKDKVCDFLFSEQYTKGWSWTWQVQREKFDDLLIKAVIKKGVQVSFEHEVVAVDFSKEIKETTVLTKAKESYKIHSRFVIDASGYGRVLPRLLELSKPSGFEPRNAVFARLKNLYKDSYTHSNHIIIDTIAEDKTWLWAIPFSDGTTSLGVVGNNDIVNECVENPKEHFVQLIENTKTVKEVFTQIELANEPRAVKGFSVGIKKMYGNGFVLCGNSTEFLDPVFSSGVTLAMESGIQAAKLLTKELKNETVDWEQNYTNYIMKGIDVFRCYVESWYNGTLHNIFFSDDVRQEMKNRICSVLAGYVWDESNPFVKKPEKVLKNLEKFVLMDSK